MSVNKVTQEELFEFEKDELLWRFSFSNSIISQLYEDDYLSFEPTKKKYLNSSEYYELSFILYIFSSALSLDSIKCLLSTLAKPYCYDMSKIYYDFVSKEWQPLPVYEEPAAAELIERLIEDKDFESLEYLKEVIENALDY